MKGQYTEIHSADPSHVSANLPRRASGDSLLDTGVSGDGLAPANPFGKQSPPAPRLVSNNAEGNPLGGRGVAANGRPMTWSADNSKKKPSNLMDGNYRGSYDDSSAENSSDREGGSSTGSDREPSAGASLLNGDFIDVTSTPKAPAPFCCLPGDPGFIFGLFMAISMIVFLVMPIVCNAALEPSNVYTVKTLPNALSRYISWCQAIYTLDEMEDLLELFAFFGNSMPSMSSGSDSVDEKVDTQVLNLLSSMKDHINTAAFLAPVKETDAIEPILQLVDNFRDAGFPSFHKEVMDHVDLMKAADLARGVRNIITRTLFTPTSVITISRISNMLQEAKMSCFSLPSCWDGAGRTKMDDVERLVGQVCNAALTTIVEIFSVIEDPRLGATDIEELVTSHVKTSESRLLLMQKGKDWLTELETLLAPYLTPAGPGADDPFFFALPPGWTVTVLSALTETLTLAKSIDDLYESRSPVSEWMRNGGEGVLDTDSGDTELLSASKIFNSVFAYDMGSGLNLEIDPDDMAGISAAYFNGALISFSVNLRKELLDQQDLAMKGLVSATYISKKKMIADIDRKTKIALVVWLIAALLIYCSMLYLLRYTLVNAPFAFPKLICLVALIFAIQIAISVSMVIEVKKIPESPRQFSAALLNGVIQGLNYIGDASNILQTGLRLALMIEASISLANTHTAQMRSMFDTLVTQVGAEPWVQAVGAYVDTVEELLDGGFNPLRQQMTSSTSLRFTSEEINRYFGFTTVLDISNGEPIEDVAKPCYASVSGAAMSSLAATFVSISSITDALYTGREAQFASTTSGAYTHGALEGTCFASAVVAASDTTMVDCLNEAVCDYPSGYGLLRTVDSPESIFGLFNPVHPENLGTLLISWREISAAYLPVEIGNLLERLETAVKTDGQTVGRTRRYVMWSGVFMCLGTQLGATVIYHLLFGVGFFTQLF